MPVHKFKCSICGNELEKYFRNYEIEIPKCCKKEMKKILNRPTLDFKGWFPGGERVI